MARFVCGKVEVEYPEGAELTTGKTWATQVVNTGVPTLSGRYLCLGQPPVATIEEATLFTFARCLDNARALALLTQNQNQGLFIYQLVNTQTGEPTLNPGATCIVCGDYNEYTHAQTNYTCYNCR